MRQHRQISEERGKRHPFRLGDVGDGNPRDRSIFDAKLLTPTQNGSTELNEGNIR